MFVRSMNNWLAAKTRHHPLSSRKDVTLLNFRKHLCLPVRLQVLGPWGWIQERNPKWQPTEKLRQDGSVIVTMPRQKMPLLPPIVGPPSGLGSALTRRGSPRTNLSLSGRQVNVNANVNERTNANELLQVCTYYLCPYANYCDSTPQSQIGKWTQILQIAYWAIMGPYLPRNLDQAVAIPTVDSS